MSEPYEDAITKAVWLDAHPMKEVDRSGRLYTITTIARSPKYGGERTPVICSTLDWARKIVETNNGDIYEYSYMLVVIEGLRPDELYSASDVDERYWYCWDREQRCYRPIETPDMYKNTFGFGVG